MKKSVALYNPYLDVLGGGEKHILSILQVLAEVGWKVDIFWESDLSKKIANQLGLSFRNLRFVPNIFFKKPLLTKLSHLQKYDLFFYVTNGSYFFSSAKKNFVFCMVPNKALYQMNLINKLKTINFRFISNSNYTQKWLEKWGISSTVIYPYIPDNLFDNQNQKKEKQILSVGRFFKHLHAKKHEEIIKTFIRFQTKYPDFKLILIGGLKNEDMLYYKSLQTLANHNKNIVFVPNASYKELRRYYQSSLFYWHFTGYGVKEDVNPEMVEHLGMTPVEAMAGGAIPFCFNAGGPKEIVKNGDNGFLFDTTEELIQKTEKLLTQNDLIQAIRSKAYEYTKTNFTYQIFKIKVTETVL